MSSITATNPPQSDIKTSKKKRGKAEAVAALADPSLTPTREGRAGSEAPSANGAAQEFPFLKELQKSLRNANKKLNATAKVDAILAEHPGKSLDELVAEKKINADQKAQALKKPALQASIAQLEEQISQFKQHAVYYEERLTSQKAELEKAHKEELESALQQKATEARESAEKDFRDRLLVLTRFLCAAAAMRASGDATSNESRAFEGALLQVYGGNEDAVSAMVKLIEGNDTQVPSTDGELLDVTYNRIKEVSLEYTPPVPEQWTGETETLETSAAAAEPSVETDPTLANAGMTELQDSSFTAATEAPTNGTGTTAPPERPPSQSMVGTAANQLAQAGWETQPPASLSASTTGEGWVDVQPPVENGEKPDNTTEGVPSFSQESGSWAQDVPVITPATNGNSGHTEDFEEVVHHARQGSGRGRGFRGRGPRGEGFRGRGGYRGDGFRGRGRGRGGEYRGARGRGGQPGAVTGSGPSTPPAQGSQW